MLSETEVVAYLGHSSLNPELSQYIVPKLVWPSSGTFQHHHQLSTSEDTASCLLGRLDTHQRASLCGQLEFVSRTSLIGFESRFFSAVRFSGVFVERSRSLEQQSASICGRLTAWGKKKSELSQLNGGTATVRVSHYTTVHHGLIESRVRNFQ